MILRLGIYVCRCFYFFRLMDVFLLNWSLSWKWLQVSFFWVNHLCAVLIYHSFTVSNETMANKMCFLNIPSLRIKTINGGHSVIFIGHQNSSHEHQKFHILSSRVNTALGYIFSVYNMWCSVVRLFHTIQLFCSSGWLCQHFTLSFCPFYSVHGK